MTGTHSSMPSDPRQAGGPGLSRRRVLAALTGGIYALIAAVLAIPSIAYVAAPARMKRRSQWVSLGSVSRFREGEPTRVAYEFRRRDGWVVAPVKKLAYVIRQAEEGFVVFSNECTHLGCGVRWDKELRQFLCPCHDGKFDEGGKVVAGPPPRPLIRYASKMEDGALYIEET